MTTNDFRDPYLQRDALALINEKRRAANLPELPGFGQYVPAPAVDHQAEYKAELKIGQQRLIARRRECGIPTSPIETKSDSPSPQCEVVITTPSADQKQPEPRPLPPISVWSTITLAASRKKWGGAIRAWLFARYIDPHGSGVVDHAALVDCLAALPLPPSTLYRWIRDAIKSKILEPVRNGNRYRIRKPEKFYRAMGATEIGPIIELDPRDLIKPGWRGLIWAGMLFQHSGPISRQTLETLTGVPTRTQQTYDQAAGVTAIENYALDGNADPRQISAYREFRRSHAFVVNTGNGQHVAYRLPNTYCIPNTIKIAGGKAKSTWARKRITQRDASVISESGGRMTSVVGGREGNFPASGRGAVGGVPYRHYFKEVAELRKLIQTSLRKRRCVGMSDFYILIPGGIARQAKNHRHQWWLVDRETPELS